MSNNKNLYWINAVKGICMLAVFYVHCMLLYGLRIDFASSLIHAFYVNGFFFISGYLLFRKQLSFPCIGESFCEYISQDGKKLLQNIFFRIILPSIIFAIIFYFPAKFVKNEEFSMCDFIWETFGGRTFWFTSALVVAELIIFLLLLTRQKSMLFYLFPISLFVVCGFYFANIDSQTYSLDFWAWRRGFLALAILGLGGVYYRFEYLIDRFFLNKYMCVCIFIFLQLIIYLLGHEDYMLISLLTLKPLGLIPSVLSVLLLIKICKSLPKWSFLDYIGKNSIGFFFLCSGIPMVLSVVFHKIIDGTYLTVFCIILFLSVFLSFVVVKIIQRYFSWLFDIRNIK